MPTTCPRHPDQPVTLVVDYPLPDPYSLAYSDTSEREFQLACTDKCASEARIGAYLMGAHPDHVDTYPATPDLIEAITGEEVAA